MISTFREASQQGAVEYLSQKAGANAGAAILGVWRSLLFVALGAGIIWAYLTNRLAGKAMAAALIAVLVVDLWSIERMYWIFSPRASTLFATDPAIDAIKADMAKSGQRSRVWTAAFSAGVVARDPAFVGDALMSHDLRIVGNYHGNELGMYRPAARQRQPLAGSRMLQIFPPPFWLHENVGYLYTGADDSTAKILGIQLKLSAPLTKIAGPVRNAAGSMVFAYKLPVDNRAAWVTSAMVKAPENQALATVLDPRFDAARVAIIDTSAKDVQVAPLQALPEPSPIRATVTSAADSAYDISLDKPATAGLGARRLGELFSGLERDRRRKGGRGGSNELQPHRRRASDGRSVGSAPFYRCCVQEGEARDTDRPDARAGRVDRWCCSGPPPAVVGCGRVGRFAAWLAAQEVVFSDIRT